MTDASDEVLIARLGGGDVDALGELFRRRQQQIYRLALHLTGSPAVADDVTQDVFVAVIRDARRFEAGRASVASWLCGIARNFVRRRLSDTRQALSLDDDGVDGPLPAVTPDPLGDLTAAEQLDTLRQAVLALPLVYREALVLCDLQEMSYADAADALSCPVGTVRSRLHRARAILAAKMQAEKKHERTSAA
jgi:RNA polymerase sigma-70 factor (ECF subfamily)